MTGSDSEYITVGKITSPYGIRGWVKVYSFTDPVTNILNFQPIYLKQSGQWRPCKIVNGRPHGKGIVIQLENMTDRNQAELLRSCEIAIQRTQLPEVEEGEFYWTDLIGCRVVTIDGSDLGVVDDLMETGANDVLVVKGDRERLLPFVMGECVKEVDLKEGVIRIDWDPEF